MTIRKSLRVERSPEISFRVFCEDMAEWWPGGFGGKEARLFLEGRVGGRFYERRPDGTEYQIGRVIAYQPPNLVAFTWRAPSWDVDTQVEVRFEAEDNGTRVVLEHSGFEQDAKTRDGRKSYDGGWDLILQHYQTGLARPRKLDVDATEPGGRSNP
jgi:uncharacterized protein YndB with AHSA1/START domain